MVQYFTSKNVRLLSCQASSFCCPCPCLFCYLLATFNSFHHRRVSLASTLCLSPLLVSFGRCNYNVLVVTCISPVAFCHFQQHMWNGCYIVFGACQLPHLVSPLFVFDANFVTCRNNYGTPPTSCAFHPVVCLLKWLWLPLKWLPCTVICLLSPRFTFLSPPLKWLSLHSHSNLWMPTCDNKDSNSSWF